MSKNEPKNTKTTSTSTPKEDNLILENSKVTVTVPWSQVEPAYNRVLQKAAGNVKLDGFRKGKVPAQVAEKWIKPDALYEETVQIVLPEAYMAELKKHNKMPISRPEVDPVKMEKGSDWVFDVYFAENQPVKLGNYKDGVRKALKTAEDEMKKAEADLKAEAKKANEDHKDHEGHSHPTELTDTQKEDIKIKHIFKNLVESVKPKVQELLVRTEVNREIQRLVDQLRQLNLDVRDYLRSRQMDEKQLQQEYAAQALTSLQLEFILAEIAKDQKFTVSDAEIDEALDKVSGGKLTPAQKQDADYRSYLFSNLLKQKVMKFLLDTK